MYVVSKKQVTDALIFLEIALYKENSIRIDPETIRRFHIPKTDQNVIIPPQLNLILAGDAIYDDLINCISEFEVTNL